MSEKRDLLEARMQNRPSQASQLMRPSVCMLPNMQPTTAATAMKTAVHVPWVETAFRPMERLRIPDPATKIQSVGKVLVSLRALTPLELSSIYPKLTQAKCSTQDLPTDSAKDEASGIVDSVDFRVTELENTNDIVGPRRDEGNDDEANHTRDESEGVEGGGNRKNTKSDLGLHHEGYCSYPSNLKLSIVSICGLRKRLNTGVMKYVHYGN